MPNNISKIHTPFVSAAVLLVLAAVCGGLAGGAAGFYAASYDFKSRLPATVATGTAAGLKVVTPTSTFALVQVERPALASVVPPAFLQRRASAVGSLYRATKAGTFEDRLLSKDRLLGQAVALTSDGWFITSAAAVAGLKSADVIVWYGGTAYPVSSGVIDRMNGTVYLKTAAKDVPAASFSRASDLQTGAETWSEDRPGQLSPSVILDLGGRPNPNELSSSEIATRRIVLNGVSATGDLGGGVWDASGQLIGIVESQAGEPVRIIPATSIASSFSSLLGKGNISHALLGVRTLDLASLRLGGSREGLPAAGALIRDEKKANHPGILRDSPAAKAKLKVGDVILRVERDILDGTADLGEVLSEYRPGTSVTLRILRDKTDMDIPVVLGETVTSEILK